MSFGFQFEDDELDDEYKTSEQVKEDVKEQVNATAGPSVIKVRAQAKKHALQELISSLPPRISYSSLTVALQDSQKVLYRRDLFDARFQLINDDEDDDEVGEEEEEVKANRGAKKPNDWETFSAGADTDLIPGVYEGGFKTWECSLDLISHLNERLIKETDSSWLRSKRITELGCGTAMPSMYLLSCMLLDNKGGKVDASFELCDFNEQVLRLVSGS